MGHADRLLGLLTAGLANPPLDTDAGRIVQAAGLGSVGLALLVLLSTLVTACAATGSAPSTRPPPRYTPR